jgi:hypothetical protein
MQRRAVGFLFCLAVAPGLVAQEARAVRAAVESSSAAIRSAAAELKP